MSVWGEFVSEMYCTYIETMLRAHWFPRSVLPSFILVFIDAAFRGFKIEQRDQGLAFELPLYSVSSVVRVLSPFAVTMYIGIQFYSRQAQT